MSDEDRGLPDPSLVARRSSLRFLFLGDIVGAPGVSFVRRVLPAVRDREALDLVIANAENSTNGSGLSPKEKLGQPR